MKQFPSFVKLFTYAFFALSFGLFMTACKGNVETTEETSIVEPVEYPFPDATIAVIDSLVREKAELGGFRMILEISKDSMVLRYGYDGRAHAPITDFSIPVEIGSATKMFTATSVLQLIEEGKFTLETPLTTLLPSDTLYNGLLEINGVNYIDSVQVKHLLNHTSGLPDYFPGTDEEVVEKYGKGDATFTTNDLLSFSKQSPKERFVPDSRFEYSNTNYMFLGQIIEKVSGQTYTDYIQEHILNPLGMTHTYFGTVDPPSNTAVGHSKNEVVHMPYSMAGPAGDIISIPDDMILFIDAWYEGKLFKNPETMTMIKSEYYNGMGSGILYGLGAINIFDKSWGHAGQTFGFQTYVAAIPNGTRFMVSIDDSFGGGIWSAALDLTGYLSQ